MYYVNQEAVIFMPHDNLNGFTSLAYDWQTDELYLLRELEYRLVKHISDSGPVSFEDLNFLTTNDEDRQSLKNILQNLTSKKILLTND